MAAQLKGALTQAVNRLGGQPKRLNAVVDSLSAMDFGDDIAWRWWWLGQPAPDGVVVESVVNAAQLSAVLSKVMDSQYLVTGEWFPYGIPDPEVFRLRLTFGEGVNPGVIAGGGIVGGGG